MLFSFQIGDLKINRINPLHSAKAKRKYIFPLYWHNQTMYEDICCRSILYIYISSVDSPRAKSFPSPTQKKKIENKITLKCVFKTLCLARKSIWGTRKLVGILNVKTINIRVNFLENKLKNIEKHKNMQKISLQQLARIR